MRMAIRKKVVCESCEAEFDVKHNMDEDYYEIDNLVENQLFVGKDPSYPYSDTVDDFGTSLSIIVECHYTRPERIGLKEQRL